MAAAMDCRLPGGDRQGGIACNTRAGGHVFTQMPWIHRWSAVVLPLVGHALLPLPAQALVVDDEFFERRVRPVLAEHCYECHSGDADRLRAELRVDGRGWLLKGGESGPAIEPGEVTASLLLQAVRQDEPDLAMPPRSRLSDQQIRDLELWVEAGAPWPGADQAPLAADGDGAGGQWFDKAARLREHWSWQPMQRTEPPTVADEAWPRSPLDRFILAELEAEDLRPAVETDRRRWLRRVTFDLTGLPPTPRQLDEFLADDSDQAYERVVDRLLADPAFGERWARHWMDLTRYAETFGHEFDYPVPQPWGYRDYLIRAFNDDLPYDQLLVEHVAGDLLEQPRLHPADGTSESLRATGFWWLHEAVHAPTDVRLDRMEHIDNRIDVFSKSFLGLTVSCARCHDHMFDAISARDYYALAGALKPMRRQLAFTDPHGRLDEWGNQMERALTAMDQRVAEAAPPPLPEMNQAFLNRVQARAEQAAAPREGEQDQNDVDRRWREAVGMGWRHPLALLWRQPDSGTLSGYERTLAESEERYALLFDFTDGIPADWQREGWAWRADDPGAGLAANDEVVARPRGIISTADLGANAAGALRSPTFKLEHPRVQLLMRGRGVQARLIIEGYQMEVHNSLLFNGTRIHGANADTDGLWQWREFHGRTGQYVGLNAYIEIVDEGDGWFELAQVRTSEHGPPPHQAHRVVADILRNTGHDAGPAAWLDHYRSRLELAWQRLADGTLERDDADLLEAWHRLGLAPTWDGWLARQRDEVHELAAAMPTPDRVLASTEGSPEDTHLLIRGQVNRPGEPVAPGLPVGLAMPPGSADGNGPLPEPPVMDRMQMARHLVSGDNPFVARVAVNRLWHHLFGTGLVASVDDFGVMGEPPSHPELLDWLALEFRDRGWSVKAMLRELVLSSTYRMASNPHPQVDPARLAALDPDNRLLAHHPLRRLQAEAIRDAMLAVSGRLDDQIGGPSVPIHLTAFMGGRGRPGGDNGPLDGAGRRSLYLETRRNFPQPFLQVFDLPTPFSTVGRRAQSSVPAQALTLMNDPLVHQLAGQWSHRLLDPSEPSNGDADAAADPDRLVRQLYRQALLREPGEVELRAMLDYWQRLEPAPAAERLADLAHIMFNLKEFIHLD